MKDLTEPGKENGYDVKTYLRQFKLRSYQNQRTLKRLEKREDSILGFLTTAELKTIRALFLFVANKSQIDLLTDRNKAQRFYCFCTSLLWKDQTTLTPKKPTKNRQSERKSRQT